MDYRANHFYFFLGIFKEYHRFKSKPKWTKMNENELNWVLWGVKPEISPSLKNQD